MVYSFEKCECGDFFRRKKKEKVYVFIRSICYLDIFRDRVNKIVSNVGMVE